jgi:hypothetical protein
MAKFTRTAYASGSLRDIAREVANQARLNTGFTGPNDLSEVYGQELSNRKAKGRKRVRITILVEPEKAPPKAPRGPRRPRPVQLALDVAPPAGTSVPVDRPLNIRWGS